MPGFDGRSDYRFDPTALPTPCFVVDLGLIRRNAAVLDRVRREAGCKMLHALKAFSMFSVFDQVRDLLDGVCASSAHEARLGREEFCGDDPAKEVHTFSAGYTEDDIFDLCRTTDHLVFNSQAQLERFRPLVADLAREYGRGIHLGLRINPEHSEGATPLYDPCAPDSRLGVRRAEFDPACLRSEHGDVVGLHWHNLCEQNADCLQRTIQAVEQGFGDFIHHLKYVNMGGGHHLTRPDYNLELLIQLVHAFRERWGVEVYLEPGEALALNAGYLVSTVLDVAQTQLPVPNVIMDSAVPCHMPDVIEMPYRPPLIHSGEPGERAWTCRIGGPSCLAGDVAGEYSFAQPLRPGDKLVFADMAIYSMVKTNTFNGIRLPAMALYEPETEELRVIRTFGYDDFRERLS